MTSLKGECVIKCHPHGQPWTVILVKQYITPPIWLKNYAYPRCLIIAIIFTTKQIDFKALIKISGENSTLLQILGFPVNALARTAESIVLTSMSLSSPVSDAVSPH